MKKLLPAFLLAVVRVHAAALTWDSSPGTVGPGDGAITSAAGTWNTSNGNWTADLGLNNIAFANGDTVALGGSPTTYSLTVAGALSVAGIGAPGTSGQKTTVTIGGGANTLAVSGNVDVATAGRELEFSPGAANALTGAFDKTGAGTLILSNPGNMNLTVVTLSGGSLGFFNGSPGAATTWTLNGGAIGSTSSTARTLGGATTVGGNIAIGTGTGLAAAAVNFTNTVGLGAGVRTLTVGSAGSTMSGVVSNGGVTKAGAGTLTLSGSNTYASGTIINAGVVVTGNLSALGAGNVSVVAGTLRVGNGAVNSVTLGAGANLAVAGTLKFNAANSLITLTGAGGYTLSNGAILDLGNLFNVAGSYTLISGGSGLKTDGAVTFANADTANFSFGFTQGQLNVTAVPEPPAYGLVGAGLFTVVALARRRRRA